MALIVFAGCCQAVRAVYIDAWLEVGSVLLCLCGRSEVKST